VNVVFLVILFSVLIFPCFSTPIYKQGDTPKVLVIIISSDNLPHYQKEEEIWRMYMHKQKENVECYFIKSDPRLRGKVKIVDDVIYSKQTEGMIPGILRKTLFSFEALLPRIKSEFDFVFRTNLSSFIIFPHLLEYLKTIPQKNVFKGPIYRDESGKTNRFWVGGFGMLFSSDVVEQVTKKSKEILEQKATHNDDVVLSEYLIDKMNIQPQTFPFAEVRNLNDYEAKKEQIDEEIFLIRQKILKANVKMTKFTFFKI